MLVNSGPVNPELLARLRRAGYTLSFATHFQLLPISLLIVMLLLFCCLEDAWLQTLLP